MTLEEGLYTHLNSDASITALAVGGIHAIELPQSPTYPALTIMRVSGFRIHNLSGPSGLAQPRISIASWAQSYNAAKALSEAVRQSIDGFSGLMGTVTVRQVHLENEIDDMEPDARLFRVICDYFIHYLEA